LWDNHSVGAAICRGFLFPAPPGITAATALSEKDRSSIHASGS
jgi:hypothetical protein